MFVDFDHKNFPGSLEPLEFVVGVFADELLPSRSLM